MNFKRPSHGVVVAYLALFVAMTGTATAATGGSFILGKGNGWLEPYMERWDQVIQRER